MLADWASQKWHLPLSSQGECKNSCPFCPLQQNEVSFQGQAFCWKRSSLLQVGHSGSRHIPVRLCFHHTPCKNGTSSDEALHSFAEFLLHRLLESRVLLSLVDSHGTRKISARRLATKDLLHKTMMMTIKASRNTIKFTYYHQSVHIHLSSELKRPKSPEFEPLLNLVKLPRTSWH